MESFETKSYYAPIPSFLISIIYFILIIIIIFFLPEIFYQTGLLNSVIISMFAIILLFSEMYVRSYHLKIKGNKIYECDLLFNKNRTIPIDEITKIRWKKESFFGMRIFDEGTETIWSEWRRQYYIESPGCTFPKYPITKRLIKDLLAKRPDIMIEKGGVIYNNPFKSKE